MAESQDLSLLSGTGPKRRGDQSQNGDEKWRHRGNDNDLTNRVKDCILNPDGVFGIHSCGEPPKRWNCTLTPPSWVGCGHVDRPDIIIAPIAPAPAIAPPMAPLVAPVSIQFSTAPSGELDGAV